MPGVGQWHSDKGRLGAPSCTRRRKNSPPQRASPVFRSLTEGHWGGPATSPIAITKRSPKDPYAYT